MCDNLIKSLCPIQVELLESNISPQGLCLEARYISPEGLIVTGKSC
jgi:hypothetical protein